MTADLHHPDRQPEPQAPAEDVRLYRRRDLVSAAGACAGLLALGGAAAVGQAGSAPVIRPPGGQNEARFSALCLRCDRCREVCHTGVIRLAKLSEGIVRMRTPVLDFSAADCDFCQKCIAVCPSGALESFFGDTVTIGIAEITQSCIALRTGGCTKCYEVCPYDAITLGERNAPLIDPDRCCGCGTCEKVCPALILQSLKAGTERGVVVRPVKPDVQQGAAQQAQHSEEVRHG